MAWCNRSSQADRRAPVRRVLLALLLAFASNGMTWANPEDPRDFARRMDLQESAISGDAEAMYALGNHYLLNDDRNLAIEWFRKSAEKDYIPALWRLGNMPRMEWTAQDYQLSKFAYEQLIRLQKYEAFSHLGDLYADAKSPFHDYEKAVLQYMDGVKQRDINAILKLAKYYMGHQGHQPNFLLAIPLLKQGVELMSPEAMHLMGTCHRYGLGMKVDAKVGWNLIFKAAQFGYHQSLMDIAEALYEGRELQKDRKLAKVYFQRALDQGYSQVAVRMKELHFEDEAVK